MSDIIYEPHQYQDELDDDDTELDPVLLEENQDMTKLLDVDPEDRKERMDANDDPGSEDAEDTREELEDLDQET